MKAGVTFRLIIALGFLLSVNFNSVAQKTVAKLNESDSMEIKEKIETFYSWYADLNKKNSINKDFNPTFVRTSAGMTALDFTNYISQLRRHSFTERFIKSRLVRFKKCSENLKKVPYETFRSFQDLHQFEEINCDFSNVNEWVGGMETPDGAELLDITYIARNKLRLRIGFYDLRPTKDYWEQTKTFIAVYSARHWKIDATIE